MSAAEIARADHAASAAAIRAALTTARLESVGLAEDLEAFTGVMMALVQIEVELSNMESAVQNMADPALDQRTEAQR